MEYLTQVEEFKNDLEGKRKAKSTIKSYRSVTTQFLNYLGEQGIEPLSYTDLDVIKYLEYKRDTGLSRASLEKIVPAINAFSTFMKKNVEVKVGDLTFLNEIEQNEVKLTVLSINVQDRMYKYAMKVYKKRNISMILLILETGIKLSELVALNRTDLHNINGTHYIKVNHKNKRTLPVSERLYSYIEHTLNSRTDQCEALFISNQNQRIGERTVINGIQRHGNLTTQILRDTYISNLIKNDVDTYLIAQLAGVTYIDTLTKKYYANEFLILDEFIEVIH